MNWLLILSIAHACLPEGYYPDARISISTNPVVWFF